MSVSFRNTSKKQSIILFFQVKYLSYVGGGDKVLPLVRDLMTKLMTREVALQFSWTGRKLNKEKFKQLKNLFEVIIRK